MAARIIAGNWKMNGLAAALPEVAGIADAAREVTVVETVIAPPVTLLPRVAGHAGITPAAQDCHAADAGAHTGDLSAPMLAEAGARAVILGHSERRANHAESDVQVAGKVWAAWGAGLRAILCIGETEAQYRGGRTVEVLARQLAASLPEGATPANTIVAYEPVWAIGTGITPCEDEIERVHRVLRDRLAARFAQGAEISLLYGGSVTAKNAASIFALQNVDGALVGGASLTAGKFVPIMNALAEKGAYA